jgi:hypothetical protein
MAKEKEMRVALAPLLTKYTDWRFKSDIFCMPIGYYIRGISFKHSWSGREQVEVWRFVAPLYEWGQGINPGWSQIYAIPGTTNHGWNVFHPQFAEKLMEVMEREIIPSTAHVQTGGDFLHYQTQNIIRSGWPNWGKAMAHIHMGELDTARNLMLPCAKHINETVPWIKAPGSWAMNLLELLRLIEEDRDVIPAHCEAVARKTVAACKLEKFWQPTPFVYDARRSKP